MEISFSSKKLRKQLNEERAMLKTFGQKRSKRIKLVLTTLRAAPRLAELGPPYSPPHRCHELTGNRKGTLSLDLDGPYRLVIQPMNNPLPRRPDGGLDWSGVTAVKILGVEDTHE